MSLTWSREDLREFIKLYPTTEVPVLMKKYGRSYRAIVNLASRLKVKQHVGLRSAQGKRAHLGYTGPRKPRMVWAKDVVKQMLEEYPHTPNKVLAEKYGVSRRAIACAANRYGVIKSPEHRTAMGKLAFAKANELYHQKRINKGGSNVYVESQDRSLQVLAGG
jgi:hypothetical protein